MVAPRQTYSLRLRLGKWAGMWVGLTAWFADQQIVATTAYARCPPNLDGFVASVGISCAALAWLGAWISWRTRQALPTADAASASLATDRFIATMSVLVAVLSSLVIVFGTPAGWILRCERF